MFVVLFFIFGLVEVTPKSLPSDIHKCSKSDPNLGKCLDKSAIEASRYLKDGSKELGILPLEPFLINKVDLGNNISGGISLHQVYKNMNIFGMTNSTMYDSDANFTGANCYWNYKISSPEIRMEADYTMKGQLLIFRLNGHGKCINYLYDSDGEYGAKCEKYTKKNKTYLRVTEFNFNLKPKKIVFDFENIIDGNEQLSKEVVKTMNENSESVFEEVGQAFNEVLGIIWKQALNQVLLRVPEDELFLP